MKMRVDPPEEESDIKTVFFFLKIELVVDGGVNDGLEKKI